MVKKEKGKKELKMTFLHLNLYYIFAEVLVLTVSIFCVCLMTRMFTNGPGDRSSIPGRVIPNT